MHSNNVTKKTAVGDGGRRQIQNAIPREGRSKSNNSSEVDKDATEDDVGKGK
jgi:hypothetical protein